uniref:Putative secreted protein n=1 Tax=Anopheles darlingi TaxID=43151 RepID=A0A2M4DMD1_ANODA
MRFIFFSTSVSIRYGVAAAAAAAATAAAATAALALVEVGATSFSRGLLVVDESVSSELSTRQGGGGLGLSFLHDP